MGGRSHVSSSGWAAAQSDRRRAGPGSSSSGSGFERFRQTYAEHDVSATDIEPAAGGSYGSDPAELLAFDDRACWRTTHYRAGDVLLFVSSPAASADKSPMSFRALPLCSQCTDMTAIDGYRG